MQVLIDTNVILDVLLNREQFVDAAVAILKLSEDEVQKFVSASAVTDIYYMAYQELRDKQFVRDLVKRLLSIIHVACVSEENILTALDSNWSDFEDSVQNAVAESQNYDAVITRNKNDYKKSMLNVFSPNEFLDYLQYDT
ncbi:MAG: PIN domain-containing protein [Spirochaetales bacterium]|nr:PIN domain-containing protein [Spirochaetales bacterium]